MSLRPILYVIGILLSTLALAMVLPMLADLYFNNSGWKVFFLCIMTTAFFGGLLVLTNSGTSLKIRPKQGFLMITLSWLVLALFSALPLWLCELEIGFTNAFFESVSGLTTTGATVLSNLENVPEGILLWRAMLQWLGGIGVILMAMSVMPFLKVGGMQLFQTELSEHEKALPRTAQLASTIGIIYAALTFACMIAYHMAGMSLFDAVTHAMSTVATGGYANYDNSFAHFDSSLIELIAVIFMVAGGGVPFILYLKFVQGNTKPLFEDTQVRWFMITLSAFIFVMVLNQVFIYNAQFQDSLIKSAFNVTSMLTGTGYSSTDFQLWGGFAMSLFFFMMVIGGSAGSTTCGIKIFRFQVLFSVANVQIKRLIHPHGVFVPHFGKRPIPEGVPAAVMGFFFMYALCFAVLALALSFVGLDFLTAMSGSASAISNVGPGLGDIIGPTGNFDPLPPSAKWMLSAGMLVGRLEIFTVLVLLSPHFWRR